MDRRAFARTVACAGTAAAMPRLARAQAAKYPSKPIHFVVPFAAGGGGDTVARLIALHFSERIKNPVIVENRVGAGGNIGSDYVLKSAPDGYTLLNMSSTYPIRAAVSQLPFDAINDMQPIMMVSREPVVLIVNANKGSSQAFQDVLSNNVDLMLTSSTFCAPFVRSGRVRALGISGTQRLPTLPDVPTFEEQGFPGYNVIDWKAIAGPRGIPPDIVTYLNTELNAVLAQRALADRVRADGTILVGGSPEQMMQIVRSDIARWKRVAEKANVKIQ